MNDSGGRRPARFLLAVIDAGGTVPPALSLAAELVRRGHQVRVLADPTVEVGPVGWMRVLPWQEAPHFNSARSRQRSPRWRAVTHTERSVLSRPTPGEDVTCRFARDVISTVRDFPVDAILADGLPGILIGAQATRRPTAALVAQTYVRPTPGCHCSAPAGHQDAAFSARRGTNLPRGWHPGC